jgi:hypothetical protein
MVITRHHSPLEKYSEEKNETYRELEKENKFLRKTTQRVTIVNHTAFIYFYKIIFKIIDF